MINCTSRYNYNSRHSITAGIGLALGSAVARSVVPLPYREEAVLYREEPPLHTRVSWMEDNT